MADTFEDLWKRLLVYAPDLPFPLAQEFINTAYSRVLSDHLWWGSRANSDIQVAADVYLTNVQVAAASATVLSINAAAAHVGRQFRLETNGANTDTRTIYTIISASPGVSFVLDRPWTGLGELAQGYVLDIYHVVPTDFLTFISVVDTSAQWQLNLGALQEDVDLWDPRRTSTGSMRFIVPTSPQPAGITATAGLPRYEIWPRSTTRTAVPFTYYKDIPLLSAATDTLITPIRGDVIRHGALAELALWPGTAERKNPYFNLDLHRTHEELFNQGIAECALDDQGIAQTMVRYAETNLPYAPLDAEYIQAHA